MIRERCACIAGASLLFLCAFLFTGYGFHDNEAQIYTYLRPIVFRAPVATFNSFNGPNVHRRLTVNRSDFMDAENLNHHPSPLTNISIYDTTIHSTSSNFLNHGSSNYLRGSLEKNHGNSTMIPKALQLRNSESSPREVPLKNSNAGVDRLWWNKREDPGIHGEWLDHGYGPNKNLDYTAKPQYPTEAKGLRDDPNYANRNSQSNFSPRRYFTLQHWEKTILGSSKARKGADVLLPQDSRQNKVKAQTQTKHSRKFSQHNDPKQYMKVVGWPRKNVNGRVNNGKSSTKWTPGRRTQCHLCSPTRLFADKMYDKWTKSPNPNEPAYVRDQKPNSPGPKYSIYSPEFTDFSFVDSFHGVGHIHGVAPYPVTYEEIASIDRRLTLQEDRNLRDLGIIEGRYDIHQQRIREVYHHTAREELG